MVALVASAIVLGRSRTSGESSASKGEIFLEAASKPGPAPFTPSVAADVAPPAPVAFPSTTAPPAGGTPVLAATGTTPGLYGGTRDNARCDAAKMAEFLRNNPDKARAWAATEGIAESDVPSFLDGLTPVILRSDVRVTNHGFSGGHATARQAVLQAGTAVLIDRTGLPRAKCACGNPLLPPQPVTTAPAYTGKRWKGYAPDKVVVVQPGPPADQVVLADVQTGQPFVRPAGTSGEADTDAPPGTDVSDPLGGATVVTTTSGPASPSSGPVALQGSVRLTAAAAKGLSAQGTTSEPVSSSFSLSVSASGDASGTYAVSFRIQASGCVYRSTFAGALTGKATADGKVAGTWAGSTAETRESGDCSTVQMVNERSDGTWEGTVVRAAAKGSGTITVGGNPVLEWEAGK